MAAFDLLNSSERIINISLKYGYELADLPVIECYMQENHQEVWITIIKK